MIRKLCARVALFFARLARAIYVLTQKKGSSPQAGLGGLTELERLCPERGPGSPVPVDALTVKEVMVPRIDMVVIKARESLEKALHLFMQRGKSRISVYEGSIDNIVGVLHLKDLLPCVLQRGWKGFRVSDFMRPPHFVPLSKNLWELMKEFREKKIRLAIVIDEYGGTAGLVTFQDVIEQVIGEIYDEREEKTPESIARKDDGSYEIDARLNLDELNQKLNTQFPISEDYSTLAGFVVTYLGRIPKTKEWFQYQNMRLTILEADPRSVIRIKLRFT